MSYPLKYFWMKQIGFADDSAIVDELLRFFGKTFSLFDWELAEEGADN